MHLVPWLLVGLLLGSLVVLWTLSKARIYDLEARLDAEQDITNSLAEQKDELRAQVENLAIPLPPVVQYRPTHRRPWPTPERKYRSELDVPLWTPACEKLALARLGMDCALAHAFDCDCVGFYRLLEHEAALGEGA